MVIKYPSPVPMSITFMDKHFFPQCDISEDDFKTIMGLSVKMAM